MKLKLLALIPALFIGVFCILLFVGIFVTDEEDSGFGFGMDFAGLNLSPEVLQHLPMVEKYCAEYGISEYVMYILAIMQVESGGVLEDVMQSSESLGLPPNTLGTEESIKQGCKYFSELLRTAESKNLDMESILQAYNFGGGFLSYVERNGGKYTFSLAEQFSKEQSGGERVNYPNPIAISKNGGWRFKYGNMFYVALVSEYLPVANFDDAVVQTLMLEALKYKGYPYKFGGASPSSSFDCSGLTKWCYAKIGIDLPHSAQGQYNMTQHIPLAQAKAGDLVFFHSTYDTADYVTHVGIVVSPTMMYDAGNPIDYTDISTSYWQQRLIGAGRIV